MFNDMKYVVKNSLTDIHKEVSIIREMLNKHFQNNKRNILQFYEHFPLKDFSDDAFILFYILFN